MKTVTKTKMPKYKVTLEYKTTKEIEVEAEDEDSAESYATEHVDEEGVETGFCYYDRTIEEID